MVFRAVSQGNRRFRPIAVVIRVMTAEYLSIKLRPGIKPARQSGLLSRLVPQTESMARRPDADDRLAGGDVGADGVELVLRRQAAAGADEEDVRLLQSFDDARKAVLVFGVGVDDRHFKAERLQFVLGELGERDFGFVFVVADQDHDIPPVMRVAERLAADEVGAGDGGADEFFDVLDDQLRPREVADERRAGRVVHGVGHVPHQDDVFAVLGHLPQAERAAEDAHVGVDAAQDDILDAAALQQVPDFHAAVADGVFLLNGQEIDLALPRGLWIPPLGGKLFVPDFVFFQVVVLAPVGLVDGILPFVFLRNMAAPFVNLRGKILRLRCRLGHFAARMILVRIHATARGMDDEHPLLPGRFQHFVEPRGHFRLAADGIQAVMSVPHVADDDGGFGRRPLLLGLLHLKGRHLFLHPLPFVHGDSLGSLGGEWQKNHHGGQGKEEDSHKIVSAEEAGEHDFDNVPMSLPIGRTGFYLALLGNSPVSLINP